MAVGRLTTISDWGEDVLNCSAIILSGGRSSRMKKNKAFLTVENLTLIETLVQKMHQVFPEVIIVTNDPEAYAFLEASVVTDLIPRNGPLSGIHAGLKAASFDYSFIVACDMPFVDLKLARFLVGLAQGHDVVVPKVGQHYEPLYAVYGKSCIPYIEKCLEQQIYKIIEFYPEVNVRVVDELTLARYADLKKVFLNVNTPEDLEAAKRMV
ncbi:molybdenum cofactor guanylyltransferase [Zhaonella formicivorans]|uniref:molybdenum cofactor guanylyltransferase n=1 Tax=Zhaonella formicivorans TaxID=2528593 RepID=UPI0026972340